MATVDFSLLRQKEMQSLGEICPLVQMVHCRDVTERLFFSHLLLGIEDIGAQRLVSFNSVPLERIIAFAHSLYIHMTFGGSELTVVVLGQIDKLQGSNSFEIDFLKLTNAHQILKNNEQLNFEAHYD
ncbi:hypothetical protein T07_13004 [Trichinella nelsoni]|uniref:Uncharacterized protein n=1 Tax=Trichinella nelsoni TaxID=6336 RepID=A0A0V0S0V1_9BILA|nr:hypothetical protein T07_13004 [Trichinella nelsoni]